MLSMIHSTPLNDQIIKIPSNTLDFKNQPLKLITVLPNIWKEIYSNNKTPVTVLTY